MVRPQRSLNRDGTFNTRRIGARKNLIRDSYHQALAMKWSRFLIYTVFVFYGVNALFALAYYFCGPSALDGVPKNLSPFQFYLECYFFSVHTLATIGYGRVAPMGFVSNVLVTVEAMTGLLYLALATGLLFARFSRPTARVLFSDTALVVTHDGVPSFIFRMANERVNQIVDAHVTVTVLLNEKTKEGETYRNFYDLKLEHERSPVFAVSWTVVHPITPDSPLFNMTAEQLREANGEFMINLVGIDDTFADTIHARFSYTPDEISWNKTYQDMLSRDEDGMLVVDLDKIHLLHP